MSTPRVVKRGGTRFEMQEKSLCAGHSLSLSVAIAMTQIKFLAQR